MMKTEEGRTIEKLCSYLIDIANNYNSIIDGEEERIKELELEENRLNDLISENEKTIDSLNKELEQIRQYKQRVIELTEQNAKLAANQQTGNLEKSESYSNDESDSNHNDPLDEMTN